MCVPWSNSARGRWDEDLVRKQRRVEVKVRMTVNVVAVTNGDPPDMAARLLANGNCALFMVEHRSTRMARMGRLE